MKIWHKFLALFHTPYIQRKLRRGETIPPGVWYINKPLIAPYRP